MHGAGIEAMGLSSGLSSSAGGRFMRSGGDTSLKLEVVILFVRPDPKPGDDISLAQADRPIMIANAHDTNAVAALLELERRMLW